ncbi:MAG TPA: isochorismatase family protein [Terriglobales bacterium]|nr:isochorismatase family protein [Terriglobales bacterium]
MFSRDVVFWEVDTQVDFMLPGGNLYVPGAEKLLPRLKALTQPAREGRVFLVSHGCFHSENDPEFKTFPPHCIKGTPGAEFVPEALTDNVLRIPNQPYVVPDISSYKQVLLEKQTLDVFESRHAEEILRQLDGNARFVVFGVVTEYCVRLAAKGLLERGRRVSIVQDAIETLAHDAATRTCDELTSMKADFISTQQALNLVR